MEKEYFKTDMFNNVNESSTKNLARKSAEKKMDDARLRMYEEYEEFEKYKASKLKGAIFQKLWDVFFGAVSIALATSIMLFIFYVILKFM